MDLNDYLSLSTDEYEKLRPKAEENSLRYIVFVLWSNKQGHPIRLKD